MISRCADWLTVCSRSTHSGDRRWCLSSSGSTGRQDDNGGAAEAIRVEQPALESSKSTRTESSEVLIESRSLAGSAVESAEAVHRTRSIGLMDRSYSVTTSMEILEALGLC